MTRNELNRQTQVDLAERLREVREDLYGEHGGQFLADAMGISRRTWLNYESGVVVPARVVLQLIVTARVNPLWLLTGQGEKYDHLSQVREADHGEC
jgi:hypothetical protein